MSNQSEKILERLFAYLLKIRFRKVKLKLTENTDNDSTFFRKFCTKPFKMIFRGKKKNR
jgi:hypothetical protein